MTDGFQFDVLSDHFDADFHGGASDVVDRRKAGNQFANMNGLLEQHIIDRKRNSREEIFRELLRKLSRILNESRQEGMPRLLQEWLQRAGVQGERVCCLNGKRLTGTFESLSPEGFPVIRLDDGTRHVHLSGDLIPAEEKIL